MLTAALLAAALHGNVARADNGDRSHPLGSQAAGFLVGLPSCCKRSTTRRIKFTGDFHLGDCDLGPIEVLRPTLATSKRT